MASKAQSTLQQARILGKAPRHRARQRAAALPHSAPLIRQCTIGSSTQHEAIGTCHQRTMASCEGSLKPATMAAISSGVTSGKEASCVSAWKQRLLARSCYTHRHKGAVDGRNAKAGSFTAWLLPTCAQMPPSWPQIAACASWPPLQDADWRRPAPQFQKVAAAMTCYIHCCPAITLRMLRSAQAAHMHARGPVAPGQLAHEVVIHIRLPRHGAAAAY